MSCSLTIQSVQGTAQGSGSVLHVTVLASSCKTMRISAECAGLTSQIYSLTGADAETVTEDLAIPCGCGRNVIVKAECVDPATGQPIPGCTPGLWTGVIDCGDNVCCVRPQITYAPGVCNAAGQRSVSFTTAFAVPASLPATCFPLIGQLDFGDGNCGVLHIISAAGAYSFADTHLYVAPASGTTTYSVSFVYANPSTCPPVGVTIDVDSCAAVSCCVRPTVEAVVGPCDELGRRSVDFKVSMNVATPGCTYVFYLDFGDGQNSTPVFLAPGDPQPAVITHLYDARILALAMAVLRFTLPTGCPDESIQVALSPSCPVDCCPDITDVEIELGPCRPDCLRSVTIRTHFSPPSAVCQAEALQWRFTDKNGAPITNVYSASFLTSGASPDAQTFLFDPADAPITATLVGLQYPDCVHVVRAIELKPCDVAPACPTVNLFTATVGGCERVKGECLRRVDFTLDAQVAAGCGINAGTKFEIDFDDGEQATLQYSTSGHVVATASHHYAGGTYQVTITVLEPVQCLGQLITVQVPACAAEDCSMDAPCPPMPTPPALCLCKLCYLFSQKPNKGWCKAIVALVGAYVGLVIVGCFLGWVSFASTNSIWQNLAAAVSLIGTLPVVLWYSKKCSDCCAACALLLGIVLAIITVIILAIYGVTLMWLNGILMLFAVVLSWLLLNNSCKTVADEQLTPDTWCKD